MSAAQPASAPEKVTIDPAVWRTLWTVLVGAMAAIFDTTIVSVALHTLSVQLHASVSTIQWVSTGYLLALAVVIPITGWAQRMLGTKRLWITALCIFLTGSILSSLAWSAPALITFRAVQGIGGGIMLPLMSTMVMQAAGGKALGQIMSVVSLPAVLGPILGPVIGGAILTHLHWPFLFWVNVPFCVGGIVLAAVLLPKDGATKRASFDVVGFTLLAPGLVGILYGLSNTSGTGGFGRADVLWPLIAGVALIIAFVFWALRRRAKALVDILLLRHWALSSSSVLLFLSGIGLYGAMLLLPLYFQQLRGMTPFEAGLLLVPQGVGTFASRAVAGRLSDKMGARWLAVIGFATVAVSTLPFAYAGGQTDEIWLMAALLVRGLGLGVVTVPLMALAFRGLERPEIPDASIISRIATQVGGAFGSAVLAVILAGALASASSPSGVAAAFDTSFWWSIGFSAVGVALSFMLPGKPPAAPAPTGTHAPTASATA